MHYAVIVLSLLLCSLNSARAQISVGVGFPGIDIGINVSTYPHLVRVPGYPVYYDPNANWNYFFYDGLYWVYQGDSWYASSWYNGPWQLVEPEVVPLFMLRVPVSYYRQPPVYFRAWPRDAAPHWGEHWGRDWEARRRGWDHWDRRHVPSAAPLPSYQRQYSGDRYPREAEQQRSIRAENYHYKPREVITQPRFQSRGTPVPAPARPQQRAPRSSGEQAHLPANQQRQQPQPRPSPPAQSVQQTQPRQQASRPQPPQTRPQFKDQESRGNRAAPQDRARDGSVAPKDKGRENEHAPVPR